MRQCKLKFNFIFASLMLSLLGKNFYSQNTTGVSPVAPVQSVMPVSPVAPVGITMPEMPSFSSPSSNSKIYKPGPIQKKQEVLTTTTQENPKTPTKNQTQVLQQTLPSRLGDLTASDLISLANQGSISSLSNILGTDNLKIENFGQNEILSKILTELNEIKANQKNLSATDFSKNKPSTESPAIRRFVINNIDVLKNCNTVFFSEQEQDGSFLLTGDCKMLYNNKSLSETFYMFFKSKGTESGHQVYDVEVSLSQSSQNQNSVLYKFTQQQKLVACQTGNLITLKTSEQEVKSDLLLDIGK